MPVFEGDPQVSVARSSSIENGDPANVSMIAMGAHTGTHIDAPRHFIEDGAPIDRISLDAVIGPARVIELSDVREISRTVIDSLCLEGEKRLLFKTANSLLWREPCFVKEFVYLTECASDYLVEIETSLVGIDYLSIERYGADRPVAHRTLLKAGVVILEGLNLSGIQPGCYKLLCLPLRIKDADGSPCRAILIEE
jgi:arylformamidase